MITYKDWAPSQHDTRGLNLPERQDWLVAPVMLTRDSKVLDESNFHVILADLGGESDTVEVHRHWACGWFEIILVHPSRAAEVQAWETKLENYCIANEDDFSRRETDAALEWWDNASLRDRMLACQARGLSGLLARKGMPPDEVFEHLRNEV